MMFSVVAPAAESSLCLIFIGVMFQFLSRYMN